MGVIHLTLGAALFNLSAVYDTGPFATVLAAQSDDDDGSVSILDTLSLNIKRLTVHLVRYLTTVHRQWGFDVGILSQSQTFGQIFTQQPATPPDRFFGKLVEMTFGFKGFYVLLKAQGLTLSMPSIQ